MVAPSVAGMVSVVSLTRCPSKMFRSSDVTPEGIPAHRQKRWDVVRRWAYERPAVPGTGVKESQLPNSAGFMNQAGARLAGAHEYLCSIKPRSESGMRKTLGIPGVLQP